MNGIPLTDLIDDYIAARFRCDNYYDLEISNARDAINKRIEEIDTRADRADLSIQTLEGVLLSIRTALEVI